MDTENQIINQRMNMKVKEEIFENEGSHLENLNSKHCFETADSGINIEIDDNKMHLWNECSQGIRENFEANDIDNIYVSENSDYGQNVKLVEIVNIKQEIQAQISDLNDRSYFKDDFNLKNMDLTDKKSDFVIKTECHTGDFEAVCPNREDSNIVAKADMKLECVDQISESDVKIENSDSFICSSKADLTRNRFNLESSFSFVGIELKVENNCSNVENCDSQFENNQKFTCGNVTDDFINERSYSIIGLSESSLDKHILVIEKDLQPVVILKKLTDSVISSWSQAQQIRKNNFHLDLQEHISNDDSHIGNGLPYTCRWLCTFCENRFKTQYELGQHLISCRPVLSHEGDEGKQITKHSSTESERPYECSLCNKRLETMEAHRKHMISHSTKTTYKCNVCDKGFKHKYNFKDHLIRHSNARPHQCNVCDTAFKTIYALRNHMIFHSNDRPHQCNMCEKRFKTVHVLKTHMISHNYEGDIKCKMCEEKVKTVYELRRHIMTSHSTEKPHEFTCSVCDKGFKTVHEHRKHMISHSSERPHQCKMCEKKFKAKHELRKHMISHSRERPHQCSTCEKGFKTVFKLNSHMIRHSTNSPHQCNICEKGFESASKLKSHSFYHSNERPHQCDVCEKRFKTTNCIRSHMRSHSTDRPYECNVCEKGFKVLTELRKHMARHSSEMPHQCNLCEKGFKTMYELKVHITRHGTERPHQCNVCGKGFKTISELKRHQLIHSDERPHQCNLCEKGFRTTNNLNSHMMRHTSNRPHQCGICDKRFMTMYEVRKHRVVHSIQ